VTLCPADPRTPPKRGLSNAAPLTTIDWNTANNADLGAGVPNALTELIPLGRTLKKCAADVLAYFDRRGLPETAGFRPRPHLQP
jgi:hypothetical protein